LAIYETWKFDLETSIAKNQSKFYEKNWTRQESMPHPRFTDQLQIIFPPWT
jgi:hypothetical protein